jgi:hypothetical protein
MDQSFAPFSTTPVEDFVRPGDIELMAQAVVDIALADWARFEALVNAPRSYAADLA